ncbi:MAG: caspase family protein [Saprospiraceae bacterium]|nr:caspase family protein [Lewinella sp.]
MSVMYALLVAINDYPSAPLKGCVNDRNTFADFLQDWCKQKGIDLRSKLLTDAEATRDGVLQSFDHFESAGTDDLCLFYFAGHGSHYPVPPHFKHLEPDGEIETIVCHDSRSPGGRDLVSKELSFRIWEVSPKNRTTPFITVMDCCHSGAFRSSLIDKSDISIRELRSTTNAIPITDFYGFKQYTKDPDGRISPPQARRIHLGAARDLETAKEVRIDGHRRGIFTYSFLEVMSQTSGALPYHELIKRINNIIRKAVSDQSAQLQATQTEDKQLLIFSNVPTPDKTIYLISHDHDRGWTVDAGAITGIPAGDEKQKTYFKLVEDGHLIAVTGVYPHYSTVHDMTGYAKHQTYSATLDRLAESRFLLAISEEMDPGLKELLQSALPFIKSNVFHVTSEISQSDFLIRGTDLAFSLHRKGETAIIGQSMPVLNEDAVAAFIQEVEIMLRWYGIMLLHNPVSTIEDSELEITVNRVIETGNYEDHTKVLAEDWSSPVLFEYIQADGKWHKPAFQFHIKNTGSRQLWVSLLYLADDFSITNQLIPMQALEAGHDVWALDFDSAGRSYITLSLKLEDFHLRRGINTIEEHLKLIVATDPFDTNQFNQKGIDWEDPGRTQIKRAFESRGQIKRPDWKSFNISILIRDPGSRSSIYASSDKKPTS